MNRLNKHLVELGLAPSRRKADELITSGAVRVNGKQITELGTKVAPDDNVSLYGREGRVREHIYIAFHKPVGFVCTHLSQTTKQRNIFDLLPLNFANLKIAGRLDKDSQGLMILSSDGGFVQNITHPSKQKSKMYLVSLDKRFSSADKAKLLAGVKLTDGISKLDHVSVIKPQLLRVVISEGRNRQIRRTFEALGYKVRVLERIKIGNLELGHLKPGAHRFIKPEEVL